VPCAICVEVIDKATSETIAVLATDQAKYTTLKAQDLKAFPPAHQPYTLQVPVQLYVSQDGSVHSDNPAGGAFGPLRSRPHGERVARTVRDEHPPLPGARLTQHAFAGGLGHIENQIAVPPRS
jgi:hypothetical protein